MARSAALTLPFVASWTMWFVAHLVPAQVNRPTIAAPPPSWATVRNLKGATTIAKMNSTTVSTTSRIKVRRSFFRPD